MVKVSFLKPSPILFGLMALLTIILGLACGSSSKPTPFPIPLDQPPLTPQPTTQQRTPSPTPTATPAPTESGEKIREPEVELCHVFVVESEPLIGGMPTSQEVIYAAADGIIQRTLERNDDSILLLREGRVDLINTFQNLDSSELQPLPDRYQEVPSGQIVLPEYAGPTLLVEFAFCDALTKQWVGSPNDAPKSVRDSVKIIKELGQGVASQPIAPGDRYIRSQLIKPHEVEFIESIVDVNDNELEINPPLKEALMHERKLIRVLPGESVYDELGLSFSHARSAHVAYDQDVYQIRHLLVGRP